MLLKTPVNPVSIDINRDIRYGLRGVTLLIILKILEVSMAGGISTETLSPGTVLNRHGLVLARSHGNPWRLIRQPSTQ